MRGLIGLCVVGCTTLFLVACGDDGATPPGTTDGTEATGDVDADEDATTGEPDTSTGEDSTAPEDTGGTDTVVDSGTTGEPDEGTTTGDVVEDTTTGDEGGTTGTDTTDPPDTNPGCPCGLDVDDCAWCELETVTCNPVEALGCHQAASELIANGTLPADFANGAGAVLYPDCMEPTCDGGLCSLRQLPGCCQAATDCSTTNESCFFSLCQPETNPPEHLSGNPPNYCDITLVEGCCSGQLNQVIEDETFSSFPELPQGWISVDQNAADSVGWQELTGDDEHCFSGGHCLFLGAAPAETGCYTYYNGAVDAECNPVPPSNAACNTVEDCGPGEECSPSGTCQLTAIAVTLSAPTQTLTPAGVPWALTFRLRMNTEPPSQNCAPDGTNCELVLAGDRLRLVAMQDVAGTTQETVVFDSVDIDNTTHDQANKYRLISVDLSGFSGETLSLEWRFDTVDNQFNDGEGIFLDDVRVQTFCENTLCSGAGDAACGTSDACTTPLCAVFEPKTLLSTETVSGFCLNPATPDCQGCSAVDDCVDPPASGGPYQASCNAGVCDYESVFCQAETVTSQSFDELPEGWSFTNDLGCSNEWTITENRATDGANSLHFGQANSACGDGVSPVCGGGAGGVCANYDCIDPNTGQFVLGNPYTGGTLETDYYDIPEQGTVLLNFDLLLSTEWDVINFDPTFCDNFGICTDRLTVTAKSQTGQIVELWDSYDALGSTFCDFENVNVNISSLGGQKVAFVFDFQTADNSSNAFEGVYLDDFRIEKLCLEDQPCTQDTQCDDGNPCTTDNCALGTCEYETTPNCCVIASDCDDGNPCTVDTCETPQCSHVIDVGFAGCCAQDAVYWQESFDGEGLPEGWTVEDNTGYPSAVNWQWMADQGSAGSGGLYFGDPAKSSYDAVGVPVKGAIVSPPLQIPTGANATVRFDLYLSTEFDDYSDESFASYQETNHILHWDRLSAWASTDNGESYQLVWRSEDSAPLRGTTRNEDGVVVWQDVAFSVQPYAGNGALRIRFEFDSLTGDENDYLGVRLDNIRVSQACTSGANPNPCLSDAWCTDGDSCTADVCNAGQCESDSITGKAGCCFAEELTGYGFEGGEAAGWTISPAADTVRWHSSSIKSKSGEYSLRFGNPGTEDYSSCICANPSGPACDAGCSEAECATESGLAAPAGTAKSPGFTMSAGQDYNLSFSLRADLEADEGNYGFLEAFTVKLKIDGPSGQVDLATLVCHAGECDVPAFPETDPCQSGVNFNYPGCGSASGDYGAWKDYSFDISTLLCAQNNSVADTFLAQLASSSATVYVVAEFQTLDNIKNCGSGLYLDDVRFSQLCTGWNGTCD